jgi:hypothetical protein
MSIHLCHSDLAGAAGKEESTLSQAGFRSAAFHRGFAYLGEGKQMLAWMEKTRGSDELEGAGAERVRALPVHDGEKCMKKLNFAGPKRTSRSERSSPIGPLPQSNAR